MQAKAKYKVGQKLLVFSPFTENKRREVIITKRRYSRDYKCWWYSHKDAETGIKGYNDLWESYFEKYNL